MTIRKIHSPMRILISSLFSLGLLTGCMAHGGAVPRNGPTMADVYETAMNQSNGDSLVQVRQQIQTPVAYSGANQLNAYTRTANNEIENLFPTLPNPELVMYIYPHLVGDDQAPIPGYSTAFSLYEREHYALPGEVQPQ